MEILIESRTPVELTTDAGADGALGHKARREPNWSSTSPPAVPTARHSITTRSGLFAAKEDTLPGRASRIGYLPEEMRSYSLSVGDSHDYLRLRETFNEDAVRYDRARPRYPVQMFDDLAAAGVASGAGVLEIGCGTGQATVPLAERGYRVVAVELGTDMAAVARRNLAAFDAVEVVTAAFEQWPLPVEPFDVVFSATAFHWIDPAVRVAKSADALRLGGLLATVGTHHIAGGSWTEAFFVEIQKRYERFDPSTPPGLRLETARDIVEDELELTSSGRFGPAKFFRYEWELPYSTADYLDLLLTYSGHRALPDVQRSALLNSIARLIDVDCGGQIVKRYLTELRIAQRVR